jgi:hypothetical protein
MKKTIPSKPNILQCIYIWGTHWGKVYQRDTMQTKHSAIHQPIITKLLCYQSWIHISNASWKTKQHKQSALIQCSVCVSCYILLLQMTSKSDTACVLNEYSWNKLWFRNDKLAFMYVTDYNPLTTQYMLIKVSALRKKTWHIDSWKYHAVGSNE